MYNMYIYDIYIYIYICYSLRKSNNYSLKSAQHITFIILWKKTMQNNFTWYLIFMPVSREDSREKKIPLNC